MLAALHHRVRQSRLQHRDPPIDHRVDPAGFDQVSATKPYYRSTYALVFAKGRGLDEVKSAADFLQLDPTRLARLKIGVYDRSPASQWLYKHALLDRAVPYAMLSPNPDQYPGEILEKDLASGKLDAAIVWGPIAGYFAKRVRTPTLAVVPLASEPGVRFDYPMAMGVRHGEREADDELLGILGQLEDGLHVAPPTPRPAAGRLSSRRGRTACRNA